MPDFEPNSQTPAEQTSTDQMPADQTLLPVQTTPTGVAALPAGTILPIDAIEFAQQLFAPYGISMIPHPVQGHVLNSAGRPWEETELIVLDVEAQVIQHTGENLRLHDFYVAMIPNPNAPRVIDVQQVHLGGTRPLALGTGGASVNSASVDSASADSASDDGTSADGALLPAVNAPGAVTPFIPGAILPTNPLELVQLLFAPYGISMVPHPVLGHMLSGPVRTWEEDERIMIEVDAQMTQHTGSNIGLHAYYCSTVENPNAPRTINMQQGRGRGRLPQGLAAAPAPGRALPAGPAQAPARTAVQPIRPVQTTTSTSTPMLSSALTFEPGTLESLQELLDLLDPDYRE